MGWLSSLGSAISGAFSSACSAIGGALSSALSVISPMLSVALEVVKVVVSVAHSVMMELGLLEPEDDLEDMGNRMLQAGEAGITPENYEKFDDYVQAIRNFDLDPEKSKKTSETEKLVAGLGFATLSLEDKFKGSDAGNLANLWLLVAKNPDFFNSDRISSILSTTTDIKSIKDYFDGKLTASETETIEKTLLTAEKSLSPDKSDNAIYADVNNAKEKYKAIE